MVMKRAEFEQRCDKLWPRFAKPLEAALAQAGLTAAQVDKVEIVGGATRIPRVKQLAKEFFNREQLDMSLNGDEACALGAALFAAKMSTSFRLREFVINDLYPHDLAVKLSGGAQFDAEEGEPGGKASKEKLLFAKGARFPRKKVLTLSRDADFSIDALVNGEPMASLEISGLAAGLATVKTPKREPVGKPKASVTFALSASGLLEVSKAEVMLDVMETYDEYVNVPIKDDDQQPAQEAAKEGKGDAGAAAGKEPADAAEPAADADAAGKEAGADGADGADGDADAAESAADDDAAAAADGEGKEEGEGAEGAAAGAADDKAEEKAEGKADDADAPKKGKGDASKPKAAKAKATKDKAKKKAPATRKEKVTKTAKRVHHVALKAAATYTTPVPVIGAAVIADCIARNQRMLDAEDVRRVDAEAKNRLEAYVLSTRDRLADDEERVALISTDAQRSELASRFEEVRARRRRAEWQREGEGGRRRLHARARAHAGRQAGRTGEARSLASARQCAARAWRAAVPAALAPLALQLCSPAPSPPRSPLPALPCGRCLRARAYAWRAQVEEWLYEDGRAVTGDVYTAKADLLRALGEPIFERLAEVRSQHTRRPTPVARPRQRPLAHARRASAGAARAHTAHRRAPPRSRHARCPLPSRRSSTRAPRPSRPRAQS
jgi:molecular chaperone DnaK (HSP70)